MLASGLTGRSYTEKNKGGHTGKKECFRLNPPPACQPPPLLLKEECSGDHWVENLEEGSRRQDDPDAGVEQEGRGDMEVKQGREEGPQSLWSQTARGHGNRQMLKPTETCPPLPPD